MQNCLACKKQIHTDWVVCPYCGEKNIPDAKKEKKEKKEAKR